jgi:hypothetical protein
MKFETKKFKTKGEATSYVNQWQHKYNTEEEIYILKSTNDKDEEPWAAVSKSKISKFTN